MTSGPLLVIAHEATRTGSPRVLLELLRFAGPSLPPLSIRLLAGGGLSADLMALSTINDPAVPPVAVLVNGAAAASHLARFAPSVPSAVYAHEEGDALRVLEPSAQEMLAGRADLVLCVSENSRRDLMALGVEAERIRLLPPVVVERVAPSPESIAEARSELAADDATAIVVGCGEAGWRKGADLFLDVARRLAGRPGLAFAWVGGGPRAFGRVLHHDARLLGLDDRLRWVGEVQQPEAYLAAADVLVFPSREDPRPLVPLEAALVGTPTVGFALGGVADLADVGAAFAAPYPDTVELARLTAALLDDAARSAEVVGAAVRRTREQQSVDVVGREFVALLNGLIASGPLPASGAGA